MVLDEFVDFAKTVTSGGKSGGSAKLSDVGIADAGTPYQRTQAIAAAQRDANARVQAAQAEGRKAFAATPSQPPQEIAPQSPADASFLRIMDGLIASLARGSVYIGDMMRDEGDAFVGPQPGAVPTSLLSSADFISQISSALEEQSQA